MRHRSSGLICAFRAFTAIVTVWCLGCSAYEPLLGSLFGSPAAPRMLCASDGAVAESMTSAANAASDGAPTASAVVSDGSSSARAFDCTCQSCHSASVTRFAVAVDPLPAPSLPSTEAIAPLSIEREPLVPPPQRAL